MKPFTFEQRDFLLKILRFRELRFSANHHLGLGDIRLTVAMQDEIEDLIKGLTVAEKKIRGVE